jgi:hypothetical protein
VFRLFGRLPRLGPLKHTQSFGDFGPFPVERDQLTFQGIRGKSRGERWLWP